MITETFKSEGQKGLYDQINLDFERTKRTKSFRKIRKFFKFFTQEIYLHFL